MSDALEFRRAVASAFFQPPPAEPEALRRFLEATLERARREHEPVTIFVAAIGLVTYGRIDLAAEALRNAPAAMPGAYLVHALRALIPFPPGADPLRDRARALAWLDAHADDFVFDAATQRYVPR